MPRTGVIEVPVVFSAFSNAKPCSISSSRLSPILESLSSVMASSSSQFTWLLRWRWFRRVDQKDGPNRCTFFESVNRTLCL